jgi:hypothetical protein
VTTPAWSAKGQAGIYLSSYAGTLQAGKTVSVVISDCSNPARASYVFINPGNKMVTVISPVPLPPAPCNC